MEAHDADGAKTVLCSSYVEGPDLRKQNNSQD